MKVVLLSGGVGGARMARGFAALDDVDLTVVVNVGDDESIHGLHVAADLDTVIYTLAGVEGPEGWGRRDESFTVNEELARFGVDNRFRLGDLDLAVNIFRTSELAKGRPLSSITSQIAEGFEIRAKVIPATDEPLRTQVQTLEGWIAFQEYFVLRGTRDQVTAIRFAGSAAPAPGVIEDLESADLVVIAPSNPPLSIWPILAVDGIRTAVEAHPRVTAVSPLIGGKALKGPADRVMASLGLPPGNRGVVDAYSGVINSLVIDHTDAAEASDLGVATLVTDTNIKELASSRRLAEEIVNL